MTVRVLIFLVLLAGSVGVYFSVTEVARCILQ